MEINRWPDDALQGHNEKQFVQLCPSLIDVTLTEKRARMFAPAPSPKHTTSFMLHSFKTTQQSRHYSLCINVMNRVTLLS